MASTGDVLSEYAAALAHRVEAVIETIQQARASGWAEGDCERVRQLAHQLSGSALTYGYHEVGQAVRRIELMVSAASVGEPAFDSLLEIALGRLRAATQHATRGPAPLVATLPLDRRAVGGRQPVVMMVDDDAALTARVVKRLRALGFAAQGFTDRDEALAAAPRLQPQVLLLDVMFAGTDDAGFELGQRLVASLDEAPSVIFLTGREDIRTRRKAAQAGAVSYLCKPVNLTALAAILEHRFADNRRSAPRVLLVEDSLPIARMYTLFFERVGIEALAVTDPLQLFDQVYEFQPDLIFLDLSLPDLDGAELCQLLRQHETLYDIPVIGLSGDTDPAALKRAMQFGMDGVLLKDNDLASLLPLIRVRAERYRRLRHSMSRDLLTGLLNRTALMERLDLEMIRARRVGRPLSLAIIDIDHFRQINDHYGHLVGDAALRQVAHEIQGRLRAVDFAGRIGGDEYGLVLPGTAVKDAAGVLRDIGERVRNTPLEQGSQSLRLSLSAGLVDSRPRRRGEPPATIADLMALADRHLYEAKRQGRDRVVSDS